MSDETVIVVRLAGPQDEAAIRSCVHDAYAVYLERMTKAPAPMLEDYRSLIEQRSVHVALVADRVVGLIVLWPEEDHLYVDNIAVRPGAQGHGVATRLLDHADAIARALDRAELRLYTNEAMTENLEFYPRRGFVETHRATDAGYRRVYFARAVSDIASDIRASSPTPGCFPPSP